MTPKTPSLSSDGPQPSAPSAAAAKPPAAKAAKNAPSATVPKADHTPAAGDPGGPAPAARVRTSSSTRASQLAACGVSMLVHVAVLLSTALIVSDHSKDEVARVIISSAPALDEEFEEMEVETPQETPVVSSESVSDAVVTSEATIVENIEVVSLAEDIDAAPVAVEFTDFGAETALASDMMASIGAVGGKSNGLGGRKAGKTGQIAAASGGGKDTENAVDSALKWLIQHQMPDGGWTFDLKKCPSCQGACSHSATDAGIEAERCGATSMALLPFLGRGYTHLEGPYKQQVNAGLDFLVQMAVKGQGKAYGRGGNMYSQGLAGIVLSEAYAMTQDNQLAMPAQLTLNYIMNAQDPVGGGWRYEPKQPGDTSAAGWQIIALKSGQMAFLQVNPLTIEKAVQFLDSIQQDEGAVYGYDEPGKANVSTTAVGLLCRMYLGWKKDHPALQRGVAAIAKRGPISHLYFDYHATQVMHHMEGDMWIAWNDKMKGMLLKSQSNKGHESGSWYEGVERDHGAKVAGRLYCTSLATLILEVYYRHMPIYRIGSEE